MRLNVTGLLVAATFTRGGCKCGFVVAVFSLVKLLVFVCVCVFVFFDYVLLELPLIRKISALWTHVPKI